MKPHALVTNDDGIRSAFLHSLVEALHIDFNISVVAPTFEQSWTSRAISSRKEIEVIKSASHFPAGVHAWAVSGTPTDCVNIALGNLLECPADIVVSGINIGYNTTETLILSSGTVAGAAEGAQWGLPAVAFSKCIPNDLFKNIRDADGQTEGDLRGSLQRAAEHARKLTWEIHKNPPEPGKVVNVNFPSTTHENSPIETTFPAKIRLGSFYEEVTPGKFRFRFPDGELLTPHPQSDRSALERGSISRSLLDFSEISQFCPNKTGPQ